ncbi:MAG: methionyl-tRNA formyltransferase [Pseudomonadota bacterium]
MSVKPRAVFFGTPDFSVPALKAVAGLAEVVLVFSQPDRVVGRGRKLKPTAVRKTAEVLGLPVRQPERLRDEHVVAALKDAKADFFFTIAYGKLLSEEILDIPPKGCLNLHASLLPWYRGSAPIQWAVMNGEKTTGLSLMLMDTGMDTGPVLASLEIEIMPGETAGALHDRMSGLAAQFIGRELPRYLRGEIDPVLQDDAQTTLAPMLKKADGQIDWDRPAQAVVSRILGLNPWPMAFCNAEDKTLRIALAEVAEDIPEALRDAEPGRILCENDRLFIKCGSGAIRVLECQAEGRKSMQADCFMRGSVLPEKVD